jgi:hypothetical protein
MRLGGLLNLTITSKTIFLLKSSTYDFLKI